MERTHRWWPYVERLMAAQEWTKADLSRAAEVDQSVIGRWQNQGAAPEPRTVRAVAAAFRRDVREAAIAAGLFTADELTSADAPLIDPDTFDLSVIPDERLRDEVYARMTRGHGGKVSPKPRRTRRTEPSAPAAVEPAAGHEVADVPPAGPPSVPSDVETDVEGGISPR